MLLLVSDAVRERIWISDIRNDGLLWMIFVV
jgi:hypothetical protein